MNKHDATIYLKGIKDFHGLDKDSEEAIDMAIEALQGDWIPVSERLPENRNEVLAYLSTGRMMIVKYNEHKLPNRNTPIGWGYSPLNGHIDFAKEDVIAWQPLPESYRPEGENK